MANMYDDMTVMQKLAKARLYFLNQRIGKSGKNMQLEFKYFELEDIVPAALRIFDKVGLLAVDDFGDDVATMTIFNAARPGESPLIFRMKYREAEQIVNKYGKTVTNPLQALGASITYLRRYLWMIALEITEPDNVDDKLGSEGEFSTEQAAAENPKPKKPATPQERAEVKEELVSTNADATPEQLEELKGLCKTLRGLDEEKQDEFVQKIAMKTEGFTIIPADVCTELCGKLREIIAEYGKSEE